MTSSPPAGAGAGTGAGSAPPMDPSRHTSPRAVQGPGPAAVDGAETSPPDGRRRVTRRSPSLEEVRRALSRPLPGAAAQERMVPSIRRKESLDRPNWKRAAVLILLYPVEGGLYFPLTRRREDLPHHPGQISLPGGSLEAGEEAAQAALRETAEELGIDSSRVELLGRLSSLKIPPSGFEIDPFVGYLPEKPRFVPEIREVAEVIEAPLSSLLTDDAMCVEEWELRGGPSTVPFWKIGDHKVWGATAMVLAELGEALVDCDH